MTTPTTDRRPTLSRTLSLRVAALVALLAIVLATVSTLAVRQLQLNQLDDTLRTTLDTQNKAPLGQDGDDHEPRGITMPGMPNGSILVVVSGNRVTAQRISSGTRTHLSQAQIADLVRVPTGGPTTVEVTALGSYRTVKVVRPGGETTIVAVSMGPQDHALKQLVLLELVLTLIAVAAAVLLSRAVILRSLRPLNRLAATATDVSRLELDKGEVELAVRVPTSDTDTTSEVGLLGRAFNHMLNNVESALASRQASETKVRQFVADASHELRNPLASIRGYAELTRRNRDELPPETAFAIGRIEAESDRMSRLVEDMLLLARLDDDPSLETRPVDVVEVVLNAVSDARAAWHDHEWTLELPADEVVAHADVFRLQQVVVNLLSNARRHTPAGTKVVTQVKSEQHWAVVTVTDDGPGIPAEVRDHVFERFARADTARAHQVESSTGLGLAIVAAVMDAHHGTALVESRRGCTRFTLRFPLFS